PRLMGRSATSPRPRPTSPGGWSMRCRRSLMVFASLCLAALSVPVAPAQQPPGPPARLDPFGDELPAGATARLGSVRFHHQGGVIAAVFAPDGKSILVAGLEKKGLSLRFWDTATGKDVARFSVADSH